MNTDESEGASRLSTVTDEVKSPGPFDAGAASAVESAATLAPAVKSTEVSSAEPVSSDPSGAGVSVDSPHVDVTGADPTKNDEVPSPQDGSTKEDVTYGDGICPLIADSPRTKKTLEVGGHEVTVQQPYRVLTDPVECPTCKKQVESSQLSWDMAAGGGTRDCTTAMSVRAHPVSKEVQAALDGAEYAKAERINDRHPLRDMFRRLLEFRGRNAQQGTP